VHSVREATQDFAADTATVGAVRRFVLDVLNQWQLDDLDWVASLVVSELATNAVLHAQTDYTVTVTKIDTLTRVSVTDRSAKLPQQRSYGTQATTGRGLRLVAEMSRAWGVEPHETGKTVWAELASGVIDSADMDETALLDLFNDDLDAHAEQPPPVQTAAARPHPPRMPAGTR
jgi:anti-sigma regulatory factor (Ser/Thr protein kinase)